VPNSLMKSDDNAEYVPVFALPPLLIGELRRDTESAHGMGMGHAGSRSLALLSPADELFDLEADSCVVPVDSMGLVCYQTICWVDK
jgi:hypothetical protein